MLNDRGTIKWNSLMLPEHVSMLKALWEEEKTVPPAKLDTQEEDRLDHILSRAYHTKGTLQITLYRNGSTMQKTGIVASIDVASKSIVLRTSTGFRHNIAVKEVVNIE